MLSCEEGFFLWLWLNTYEVEINSRICQVILSIQVRGNYKFITARLTPPFSHFNLVHCLKNPTLLFIIFFGLFFFLFFSVSTPLYLLSLLGFVVVLVVIIMVVVVVVVCCCDLWLLMPVLLQYAPIIIIIDCGERRRRKKNYNWFNFRYVGSTFF